MSRRMTTYRGLSLAMLLAAPLFSGCGWFQAAERAKGMTIASQYTGLADKSVAIVIYTQPATLNEYPGTREEVSQFVANEMRLHLPTTRLLSYQDVIAWQNNTMNWYGLSERDIGKHFSVDRVLYIEVLDYSTKRTIGYSDLQGRLRAQCKIVDTTSAVAAAEWTGLIDVYWPKDHALDPTQTNENAVRLRTLEQFAGALVKCFYDHQDR